MIDVDGDRGGAMIADVFDRLHASTLLCTIFRTAADRWSVAMPVVVLLLYW
jgi:hypothetical protein